MRLSAPNLLVDIGELKELAANAHDRRRFRLGALTRHSELLRSELFASTIPSPHAGRRAYRPCGDPQSRHARREPRLCRSGSRAAGLLRGARGHDRAGLARGRARGQCRRLLQGPVRNRSPAGRTDRRGEISGGAAERPRWVSPSSRAGMATSPWRDWRQSATRGAAGSRRPGWSISAASTAPGSRESVSAAVAGLRLPMPDNCAFEQAIRQDLTPGRHAGPARRHQASHGHGAHAPRP